MELAEHGASKQQTKGDQVTFSKGLTVKMFFRKWKISIIITAALVVIMLIVIIAMAAKKSGAKEKYVMQGCSSFDRPPVILIGMDGFIPDFMQKPYSSNISKLAKHGVEADFLLPQFPTSTFPNFYTLATGLYPESHGIVANSFLDGKDRFKIGGKGIFNPKWWDRGEPIWLTSKKQGLKTASMFWVGSEAEGRNPDYWFPYDGRKPFSDRVDQVLSWIDMEPSERPSLIALYFQEPDSAEHRNGRSSAAATAAVAKVDAAIGRLLAGLQQRKIRNCTNLVLVSDHGMADVDCKRTISFDQFLPDVKNISFQGLGAFSMAYIPKSINPDTVLNHSECYARQLRAYSKTGAELPVRMHYSNNRRIGDVVFIPDEGWSVIISNDTCRTTFKGSHGYDNIDESMKAVFLANGPAFKRGLKVDYFSSIQVYNLIAGLLGVTPAKSNGTLGYLNHILADASKYGTDYTKETSDGNSFAILKRSDWARSSNCTKCICPYCESEIRGNMTKVQNSLNLTEDEVSQSMSTHLPYGVPQGGAGTGGKLLVQRHYVTAYSTNLHIPLWVSYFLTKEQLAINLPRKNCFRSDFRLSSSAASNCLNYKNSGFDRGHLAPNGDFNFDRLAEQDAAVLSNIAPMHPTFNRSPGLWQNLETFTRKHAEAVGNITVMSGSIFDMNSDGLRDEDIDSKRWLKGETHGVPIPTHFFKILAWCNSSKEPVYRHPSCNGNIEVISFIVPHQQEKACNKRSSAEHLLDYFASVDDIERITGVNFFSGLPTEVQAQIESRLPVKLV